MAKKKARLAISISNSDSDNHKDVYDSDSDSNKGRLPSSHSDEAPIRLFKSRLTTESHDLTMTKFNRLRFVAQNSNQL